LLFLVEPMLAKMALPMLGGTPAVWNTRLVFFRRCCWPAARRHLDQGSSLRSGS
jgi:hypothetical protein